MASPLQPCEPAGPVPYDDAIVVGQCAFQALMSTFQERCLGLLIHDGSWPILMIRRARENGVPR
jgi:hypothetical protein